MQRKIFPYTNSSGINSFKLFPNKYMLYDDWPRNPTGKNPVNTSCVGGILCMINRHMYIVIIAEAMQMDNAHNM